MNTRFSETSKIIASSFKLKSEIIEAFYRSTNKKSLFEIYAVYSACLFLRDFMDTNETTHEDLLVDTNGLDTPIKSYESNMFSEKQSSLLNKIEACEEILESNYAKEMISIKGIHEYNTYENNLFMQSLNKDIILLQKNNYTSPSLREMTDPKTGATILETAKNESTTKKWYIQLVFKYSSFKIGAEAGGGMAILASQAKILDKLPTDATPGKFSKQLKSTIFNDNVYAGYIHDCGDLNIDQVKEAVRLFNKHYHIKDNQPVTCIESIKPKQNEIIANLTTVVNNMSLDPCERQPLLKNLSFDDRDDFHSMLMS